MSGEEVKGTMAKNAVQSELQLYLREINGIPLLSLGQLKAVMDNSAGQIELSLGDDDLPLMLNPHALKSADEDIKKWYQVHQMSHLRTTSSLGDSGHDLH